MRSPIRASHFLNSPASWITAPPPRSLMSTLLPLPKANADLMAAQRDQDSAKASAGVDFDENPPAADLHRRSASGSSS
jgi:hypothetical protein